MTTLHILLSIAVALLPANNLESNESYWAKVGESGNFSGHASRILDKELRVNNEITKLEKSGQGAPIAGVYVHIPEPGAEPVVEEWLVRQQGGQCVVGSDDGSGSVIRECQTIPEGRPGPPEQSPSPDSEESEDPEESEPEPVFITVTQSEFAELPFEAPEVNLQPDRGWVLVNMDTVVYADDAPQVLTTELLGVPVAVRATPVEFAWDFGDGSAPVVTTSGGRPWPNQSVAHAYTHASQERIVTLTTTWSGEFQVAGQGPWVPIAGTVTTTSQSAPFAVETRHSHLVGAQGN